MPSHNMPNRSSAIPGRMVHSGDYSIIPVPLCPREKKEDIPVLFLITNVIFAEVVDERFEALFFDGLAHAFQQLLVVG